MSSAHDDLRKILAVEQLPAMPHSALTVLQLDNDLTKVDINDLVRPIEADPGLAAQVLKFLNSSYFGFQSTISSVKQGITLVGIRIVKNFVLWKAVFSLIPKSKIGSFDVASLWQDSLRRAMFARFMLLEKKKGDAEMCFAGALLQDMAIPLLLKQRMQSYGSVLNQLQIQQDRRLSALEQAEFSWNHADAGAVLGETWKLPSTLITLIENHLKVDELVDRFEEQPEQAVVALSALLPSVTKENWTEKEMFLSYLTRIDSNAEAMAKTFFNKVDQEFDQYAAIIQIGKPKKKLISYLEE